MIHDAVPPMTIAVDLQAFSPCDSLYVSPHHDDVLLSCGARLLADAARGLRILVVTVFGEGGRPWPEVGRPGHARTCAALSLGLPDARRRSDYYSSFQALVEGRRDDDDRWVSQIAQALGDIAHRSKASQVYMPLGVGSHIDHRLSHEASLRGFQSGDGRNVFLYEERPEAFVRGRRARAPGPGGRAAAARPPPRPPTGPASRRSCGASTSRRRCAATSRAGPSVSARRGWPPGSGARDSAWHPQKGFGPRLQPVVQPTDARAARGRAPAPGRARPHERERPSASPASPPPTRAGWAGASTPSASGCCCRRAKKAASRRWPKSDEPLPARAG